VVTLVSGTLSPMPMGFSATVVALAAATGKGVEVRAASKAASSRALASWPT
jgi:hypothetical protein